MSNGSDDHFDGGYQHALESVEEAKGQRRGEL